MAELFGVNVPAVNKHLKNIYGSAELSREATISILETVRKEGKPEVTRAMEFYRLEAILAVGYRFNSSQATGFRKWATTTLSQIDTRHSHAFIPPNLYHPLNHFRKNKFDFR